MPITIPPICIPVIICGGCCAICICNTGNIERHIEYYRNRRYYSYSMVHPFPPEQQSMEEMKSKNTDKYILILSPRKEYQLGISV